MTRACQGLLQKYVPTRPAHVSMGQRMCAFISVLGWHLHGALSCGPLECQANCAGKNTRHERHKAAEPVCYTSRRYKASDTRQQNPCATPRADTRRATQGSREAKGCIVCACAMRQAQGPGNMRGWWHGCTLRFGDRLVQPSPSTGCLPSPKSVVVYPRQS
jgi:hypothetical protein